MQVFKVNDNNFKNSLTIKILSDLGEYFDTLMKKRIISNLSNDIYFAVQDNYGFQGFVSLLDIGNFLEIDGIGIFKNFHRQKAGQALIKASFDYAKLNNKKGIIIKIKDDSSKDMNYIKTRRFFTKMGFNNLTVINSTDFINPCLVMIYLFK